MKTLKYSIIKTEEQYFKYCDTLEILLSQNTQEAVDEVELLTLLIEKWDADHTSFKKLNPIELIKALMEENGLKSKDLVNILGLSKGTISKILNYQKGISKETIRALSSHFKVSQEAFNRPYKLIDPINRHYRFASLMNTEKDIKSLGVACS